ncbi:MAG: PH domain-containing protein [Phycisphaerales bacterium]|nr:PH domain-containing protein [Phycisphaerales bacterium]
MTRSDAKPTPPVDDWTAHPARQRPGAAVFASAVIVAFSVVVELATGERWMAGVSLVVLLVALHRFFLPTRVVLTDEAVEVREPFSTRRLRWEEIRRADFGRFGVWLSPLRKPTIRESRRGAHVLYDGAGRECAEAIRARLPADCVALGLGAPRHAGHGAQESGEQAHRRDQRQAGAERD